MADRGRTIFFPILDKEGWLLGRQKKKCWHNWIDFWSYRDIRWRTISVYYSRPKEPFLSVVRYGGKKLFEESFLRKLGERKGTTTRRNFIDARSGLAFRPNRWPVEEPRRWERRPCSRMTWCSLDWFLSVAKILDCIPCTRICFRSSPRAWREPKIRYDRLVKNVFRPTENPSKSMRSSFAFGSRDIVADGYYRSIPSLLR